MCVSESVSRMLNTDGRVGLGFIDFCSLYNELQGSQFVEEKGV